MRIGKWLALAAVAAALGACGSSDEPSDVAGGGDTGGDVARGADATAPRTSEEARHERKRSERAGKARKKRERARRRGSRARRHQQAARQRHRARRRHTSKRRSHRPVTRAFVVAKGDRACGDYRTRVSELNRDEENVHDPALRTRRLAALTASVVGRLAALGRPNQGAATFESYLRTLETQVDRLYALSDALDRKDEHEAARLNDEVKATGARASSLARTFGFHVCGSRS